MAGKDASGPPQGATDYGQLEESLLSLKNQGMYINLEEEHTTERSGFPNSVALSGLLTFFPFPTMVIALIFYAAICIALLVVAVKLLVTAFRVPDSVAEAEADSMADSLQSSGNTTPSIPGQSGGKHPRRRTEQEDVVEMLERQFRNSPSISSNPED